MPFLGIHRNAGVVSHVLMGAGGDVEKGSLAAVGVPYEGNSDDMVPLFGDMGESSVQPVLLVQISRKRLKVLVALKGFAGLFFADDFYHLSLLSSEGDFITYDFIFNRVSQRGVEDYCHSLPLNKSHLNESFSEATMSVDSDNYSFFSSF